MKTVKYAIILFLCAALCASAVVLPIRVRAVDVSAVSALLMEADGGRVLYEKNAHSRMGPASTTKIMTALVAIENMPLDTVITVPREACGIEGSSVYLYEGEQLTLETLLYALMLQSANDAAVAIAIAVAGSIGAFVTMMNEKAQSLGLRDTHFENPHGLDCDGHYTTACDLARIAGCALKNEVFATIVSTVRKSIPMHDGTASRLLVNHNRLLRTYPDITGVKTGYTRHTGRTLVSSAERDGIRLICVTLDDGDDWRDHRALLDMGYEMCERVTLCRANDTVGRVHVCGSEVGDVGVCYGAEVTVTLPRGHGEIVTGYELPKFLYSGIKSGDHVGTARFYSGTEIIAEVELVSMDDAPSAPKKERILPFWRK